MHDGAIGLGWRVVHSTSAVVVAVSGSPSSPEVVHREVVTLLEDESVQEPYHAATGVPFDEAPALIASIAETAAVAAEAAIRGLASTVGALAAVGVVGGGRRLPELSRILSKHALLHAADRDLYEQAIIEGAARTGLSVSTIPATGALFDHASDLLGVPLQPTLAALGKTIGAPWQKDHREATAAALVALHGAG